MKIIKIDLTQIPKNEILTGYLWKSDRQNPIMIINEHLTSIPNSNENPFIIEGNLFDKNHQFSYYIKYVDGEYLVFRYEMDKTEDLFTLENYIPNKLPGVDKICFRQYWKSGPDDFCEGMEVLKPFTSVFVGFKYKEK